MYCFGESVRLKTVSFAPWSENISTVVEMFIIVLLTVSRLQSMPDLLVFQRAMRPPENPDWCVRPHRLGLDWSYAMPSRGRNDGTWDPTTMIVHN
jgi:hypothetical protein